jgi:hypothetical protein
MDSIARKNTGAPFPEARAHRVCFVIAFDKVGAGEGLCFVVAVSARQHQDSPGWGGYTVDEVARRNDVSVEKETKRSEGGVRAVHAPRPRPISRRWLLYAYLADALTAKARGDPVPILT